MATLQELLSMCASGDGRIVSTGELTELQIADARANNRMFVDSDGLGYVLLPWGCYCRKDILADDQVLEQ